LFPPLLIVPHHSSDVPLTFSWSSWDRILPSQRPQVRQPVFGPRAFRPVNFHAQTFSKHFPLRISPYYLPGCNREKSEDLLNQCLASAASPYLSKQGAFLFRDSSQEGKFVFSHAWPEGAQTRIEHKLIDSTAPSEWKQLALQHGRRINSDFVKIMRILATNAITIFSAKSNDYFMTSQTLAQDDGPSVGYYGDDRLTYNVDGQCTLPLNVIEKEGLAIALGACTNLRCFELRKGLNMRCSGL
jgi:hypothetical protein